jgi:uncharacterized protein (TIGR02677 family)
LIVRWFEVREVGVASRSADWKRLSRVLFSPASVDRRELHLAVLDCFAQALFEPALNLEQLSVRLGALAPELAGDDELLVDVLRQACGWGHLTESRDDTATYRDPAEFRRRSAQWSLTADGQATIAALDAAVDRIEAVASLQPATLDQIAAALAEVARLAGGPSSPPANAQLHLILAEAEGHHSSLVENLRTFTVDVQNLLTAANVSDVHVEQAKASIIGYLNRYVEDAEVPARRVAAALGQIEAVGSEAVVARAVEGANLAPSPGDGGKVRAAEERRRNLAALAEWFVGDVAAEPQFSMLLPRGREAVVSFLRLLDLRRDQRRRSASLREDFRALARAAAGCGSREEAHRLWSAASGLHPARHHHLVADGVDAVESATLAAGNPAVELEVELRRRARSTGRPAHGRPLPDLSGSRGERQAAQALEVAARLAALADIHRPEPVSVASFAALDDTNFDAFVDLLARGLSSDPEGDGTRRSASPDGRVSIVCWPPTAGAALATVTCPRGTLTCPDRLVTIVVDGVEVAGAGVAGRAGGW